MKLSQRRLARPSLGAMMATRQGALTLAVLCAVFAAGILMFALGHYKSSLKTVTKQATVLVASGSIPKGTSWETIASEGLYKSVPVLATQVTPGAISDAGQLAGDTAQVNILAGQQLTTNDFSTVVGVSGVLAPNQRAVAISIDEAHGASDILQAGDHVDVYGYFTASQATAGSSSSGSKSSSSSSSSSTPSAKGSPSSITGPYESGSVLTLIDSDATVIKPASTTPTKSGGTIVSGASLVLAVDATKAGPVIFAADNNAIYLSVRPQTTATVTPPYQYTVPWILNADPVGSVKFSPTTSPFGTYSASKNTSDYSNPNPTTKGAQP